MSVRLSVALGVVGLLLAAPAFARTPRPTVVVKGSAYGRILFDGRGFVLYGFTRDARGRSACSGACARAWPPYIVKAPPHPTRFLGTTKRADGSLQVTYAGRPLYYDVGYNGPGVIRCQNVTEFCGVWLVQRPTGQPVR